MNAASGPPVSAGLLLTWRRQRVHGQEPRRVPAANHHRPRRLGGNRWSFCPFKGSRVHLVSFPGESSSIREAGYVGQSLMPGLIPRASPGSPLICCLHHGVASSVLFSPLTSFSKGLFNTAVLHAERNPSFSFLSQPIPLTGRNLVPPAPVWAEPLELRIFSLTLPAQLSTESNPAAQPDAGLNVLPGTSREAHARWDAAGLPAAPRLPKRCSTACRWEPLPAPTAQSTNSF